MHLSLATLVLVAQSTTIDKLRRIPVETWWNLAIVLVGIYVVVRFWGTLRRLNEYAPYVACGVVACTVFFYWVYNRTEPAFLTPVVQRLTPFFPTKQQQQQNVDEARRRRESSS